MKRIADLLDVKDIEEMPPRWRSGLLDERQLIAVWKYNRQRISARNRRVNANFDV